MSINHLIIRNLKKNLKNYYLYVFALVFSVALYFAFVTLQYDPAMDATKGSIKGGASIRAASVLLVAIVAIFLLYANTIFIKRRSKEIGLFQLIGMTKSRIFHILSTENFFLYFGSLVIGIFLGFSFSRFIMMILLKVTQVDADAVLRFSTKALVQTLIVFGTIYLLIMLMNYIFIKKQSILALFRITSSTEQKIMKLSISEILIGITGMILIAVGYYVSSKLFGGDFTTINELFMAMIGILGSVIIGTYLFYKGSVSFIFHLIRKKKDGYLNINEVLSLSSIMFRMKSNALLLTIITTVSALAIGLLSLSYISYYSAEKIAENNVAADFAFTKTKDAEQFKKALEENHLPFNEKSGEVIQVNADLSAIMENGLQELTINPNSVPLPVVSDKAMIDMDLSPEETIFTGYNDLLQSFMSLKNSGQIKLHGQNEAISLQYKGLEKEFIVSRYFTGGGFPVVVVNDFVFKQLKNNLDPTIQKESSLFIGITLNDEEHVTKANNLFKEMFGNEDNSMDSRLEMSNYQKQKMGLIMFIVSFLGLTFLITSGCILYFKQMGEGEEEMPSYTILRKLGFTRGDLVKGIRGKQLFSFGIPLVIGLSHSYFAVKSGWFLFGTELWTPMIVVMVVYATLYSIFGMLSVQYYKKVIKEAL